MMSIHKMYKLQEMLSKYERFHDINTIKNTKGQKDKLKNSFILSVL